MGRLYGVSNSEAAMTSLNELRNKEIRSTEEV